jgi:hypothetical protein
MPFDEYVELMKQEARSEYRRYLQTHSSAIPPKMIGNVVE